MLKSDPFDSRAQRVWADVQRFTLTSVPSASALCGAIGRLSHEDGYGDVVLCGIWHGGMAMLAASELGRHGAGQRRIIIVHDVNLLGSSDQDSAEAAMRARFDEFDISHELISFVSPLDADSMASTGANAALLMVDPLLCNPASPQMLALVEAAGSACRILYDGFSTRMEGVIPGSVRPGASEPSGAIAELSERYDYHAPSLRRAALGPFFPTLAARDPRKIDWPYLRVAIPHCWRSDARSPRAADTGVLSIEEAELLYNNALQMKGRRGLEIGCHYGWSTAHLLLAGLELDVVDPALGFNDQQLAVISNLSMVETTGSYRLWAGYSPSILPAVLATDERRWSFAFIDGYHEQRAPLDDAETVLTSCDGEACVMFHDLTSPFVAAGLRHFAREGWTVRIYDTMQIMGIAWRGGFAPVEHVRDPNVFETGAPHLRDVISLSKS